GTYYPFDVYADGPYKEAYETRNYVHVSGAVTSEGSWLFVCGPIFDREGNVAALIETGYNMRSVLEQTRTIIIQTSLIVAAATVAFLLIIIEFILILTAYKKNKNEIKHRSAPFSRRTARALVVLMVEAYKKIVKQESSKHIIPEHIKKAIAFMLESYKKKAESTKDPPFYPELLRALIFFLFIANNLEAALLPMYAANLYEPLFNFSKEFVITLPLVADMGSAALALLIIPLIFEKFGIKRIGLLAVIFIFIGNIMCFIAANTAHLAVAHFFTGFAGGSLLLVINAIIGAQKDVKDVNSGFAHFNASYLAGVNVGVVIGSILAQFFPYRMVYLFSSLAALILVFIFIFSIRSKLLKHFYDITGFANTQEPGEKSSLLKFIFKPVVLGTLLLLLLPYAMSLSFTSYFMPIYGIENGLRESNVGQLILLSGLFAILFGTSLCEYAGQKLSLKMIITISLLLNVGGIFLFSLSVSVFMLILAVAVLAVANIFAATYIQTFYSTLYQNENISSAKALSVYSAVENISMSIGPIVYSYILAYNIGTGMMLFASGALVCLVVFLISSFLSDRGNKRRLSL
ncbi:MAG: MFS transporter, partial [Treponema sp.]|nr:MFS transporter [Treponema sp.]